MAAKKTKIEPITIDFEKLLKEPDKRVYDLLIHIIEKAGYTFESIHTETNDYCYAIITEEYARNKKDAQKFVKAIEKVTGLKFSDPRNYGEFAYENENWLVSIPLTDAYCDEDEIDPYWLWFEKKVDKDFDTRPYLSSVFEENEDKSEYFGYCG